MAFLVLHSTLASLLCFLLVLHPLTHIILIHIFFYISCYTRPLVIPCYQLYHYLSIYLHVLLSVYHDITRLSLLSTSHSLVHISYLFLTPNLPLSTIYLLYYSNYFFVFTSSYFYIYLRSFYYYFNSVMNLLFFY